MEDKLQEYRDAFGEQFPLMLVQGMDDDDILAEIEGCLKRGVPYEPEPNIKY